MVSPKDIEFESDIQEKISIEDIRAEYNDGVIIWLNGSGPSPNRKLGSYRCVLDYNGHIKFMETEIVGATSNKTMIIGAIDAIKCISKPIRLYNVYTAALGLAKGFRGSGPNGLLVQEMYELIKEKSVHLLKFNASIVGIQLKILYILVIQISQRKIKKKESINIKNYYIMNVLIRLRKF